MTQVLTQATKKVGNMMNEVKFGNWLKEFKSVDRPIGNLAKDMLRADDVEKFNRFKTVEDIPHELPYKVYEVAVEVFEYYLVDSVDKYDIEYILVKAFLEDAVIDDLNKDNGGITITETWRLFNIWLDENDHSSNLQRKQFNNQIEKLGYKKIKTRKHQSKEATKSTSWSWYGLDLNIYQ